MKFPTFSPHPSDRLSAPQQRRPASGPPAADGPAGGRLAPEPLTGHEIALVRSSLAVVEPLAGDMTVYFYSILFTRYPQVRELFPSNMDVQRDRLLRGLLQIVSLVDDLDNLVRFCSRLGRDHRKFGALDGHYPAVGECLLSSLARFAGPAWTDEIAQAWGRAYTAASRVMMLAAEDDARLRPAVWPAEIVHHLQHGHGIAEVTVRTELPYPYVAGQYATLETPWAPKSWRSYSPAHAPREDSTLTFHVRAVPGGQVSNALVHHAKAGDVVRLGPPQGDMTLDVSGERDLVCVAGGTGIAPLRALVEQAARNGMSRYVDLFVGARTANELYGLDDMLRMSQRHHWLSVRAAVSHERILGREGTLPQVLREFGPWTQHEAFVCGPVRMVEEAVHVLRQSGVPTTRIHHDPLGTPVLTAPLIPLRQQQENDAP